MTSDGITRAERRVLGRAGVDVMLTFNSFKLPGVQERQIQTPNPNRKAFFANKSTGPKIRFNDGTAPPDMSAAKNAQNVFMPRDDDDDDNNTESYNKVRKIIFGQAIKYNITKLEQKYVNFTDIVDINDYEALENHVSEDLAARFGEGDFFRLFMLTVILLNSIMIALQTDDNLAEEGTFVFTLLDYIFLALYILEILFKWFYGFVQFWKVGWNIFDLLLVLTSIIGTGLSYVLLSSNAFEAMYTLFIMITQIGWVQSFDALEAQGQFIPAAIYYSSFMVIGVFIFMKIIVAVVVSNLEETYANEKKQERQKFRALKTFAASTQGIKKYQRPVRPMPYGESSVWKNQIPYEIPDFEKISKAKIENYLLILSIIEENLKEYSRLKDQIAEIQFELKLINTPIGVDEEEENVEAVHEEEAEGDALSRWMAAKAKAN
ncbi:Cation channel sperm-associated protein 4 [Irineochytrium annulatum]|nr:Cation channel sperm-associated protein 4 [Irineochytrium annulatum]